MTQIKKATTNVVRYFMVRLVADGKAATGLTITTFDLQYTRELTAAATKIDAIVGTGGATTHVDNKIFELDSTSSPGLYMVCFPDAAFATGVDQVTLNLKYDSTVFTEAQNIQLVDFDPFDAVRMGMTALPNAAADAALGLPISDAGGLDLDAMNTAAVRLTAVRAAILTDWIDGGRLDLLLDAIPTTAMRGTDGANTTTPPTAAAIVNEWESQSQADPTGFHVNLLEMAGDPAPVTALGDQYDGVTGLSGGTYPATQSQLSGIANVGSAVHRPAASYVLTTGTQSANTVGDVEALDGVRHTHTDVGAALDLYYEANIGSGIPSSVQVTGYVTGNNDDVDVYGYDWVAAAWVQIGSLQGTNTAENAVKSYDLFVDMVGTGANAGTVRWRFFKASGLTSAVLAIDQTFVAFSQGIEGYQNASVWFDSNASNTGTTKTDGTATNPVSTEAAVNTLLANNGLSRVEVRPSSSIVFATGHDDEVWVGEQWTLGLGGQSISGSTFMGADVSGIGTGAARPKFIGGDLGTMTIVPFHSDDVSLSGTITFSAAGNYEISNAHSGIAGSSTPIIDTGAAVANVNLTMPGYEQGVEIQNLNATGADLFSISGKGQIIYAASSSGNVNQRGDWKVTNTGGVTIVADDNTQGFLDMQGSTFDTSTDSLEAIRNRGDIAWITGGGGGLTQILNMQPVLPTSIDLANTSTARLGLILINSLDDLPSTAEITPGTISIDRKAIGGTSWSAVVTNAAMSEQAGMVYFDEVFDSGSGYAEGDSIRVTFKSVSITADSNTHEICDTNGIIFQTEIRQSMRGTDGVDTSTMRGTDGVDTATMRGTDSAALASVATEARLAELDAGNLPTDVAAIPTTAMRGTDNAATAAALSIAQTDLDTITDTDGVILGAAGVALIWNEILSKDAYNIGQSAGKLMRQGADLVQIDGAVSDVSPSISSFDTNLTQPDTYFEDAVLIFANGSANAGIGMPISAYLNANGNMTFATPDDWPVTPVNGDDFVIFATHVHPVAQIQSGLATEAKQDAIKADTVIPARNAIFSAIPVLMVAAADHVTPTAGLIVTVNRSLDGAAFGAVTGSISEVGNGLYSFDASAADMDADKVTFRFSAATADDTFLTLVTR